MNDSTVFGQPIPDARSGLRARYAQLEAAPEAKDRRRKSERLQGISQSVTIIAVFATVLVGLLAAFTTLLEAIGHPGLLATGALLGGVALLVLLPGAGILSAVDDFRLTFSRVFPGITEEEIAAILAGIEENERADPFRAPSDLAEQRQRIIAANTRPATGAVLAKAIKGTIPTVLLPAILALPLLAIGVGLIAAPLAWIIMGAYILLWIAGTFVAIGFTFFAN